MDNPNIKKRECQNCINYKFIDSCFGWCKRFPPTVKRIRKWFKKETYVSVYPMVTYDDGGCGELRFRK